MNSDPRNSCFRRLRILFRSILLLGALVSVSCGSTRTAKTEVYEDRRTGVELRRIVKPDSALFAEQYSHPAEFSVDDLKYLLSKIGYREKGLFGWSEIKSVFAAEELYRSAPHLVEAFRRASPDDEVLFRLTSAKPGAIFSTERFTNGAMFIKDGGLNCVFANVNIRPDAASIYDGNPRNTYAGVLWRLEARDWQSLVEGEKGVHYNWLKLDMERGLREKERREQAIKKRIERQQTPDSGREPAEWSDWRPGEPLGEGGSRQ